MSTPSRRPAWAFFGVAFEPLAVIAVCAVAAAGALWWFSSRAAPATPGAAQTSVRAIQSLAVVAAPDAATAALQNPRGQVAVQMPDGAWQPASVSALVHAGGQVRTGALSSVTLAFYDGSTVRLGPQTELRVTTLDAQRAGARRVRLELLSGASDHLVTASSDPASSYEVTAAGAAGAAQGTAFHVSVTPALTRFTVTEGAVAVTNLNLTVLVAAGQTTTILVGQPPAPPAYRITGEGEVQQTGATWLIAGQALDITPATVIRGEPAVGAWAAFEGQRLANGRQTADQITFMRPGLENAFTFVGTVEGLGTPDAAGVAIWLISGRAVHTAAASTIAAGLVVSDAVEVAGGLAADGVFWATTLLPVNAAPAAAPFSFTGVANAVSAETWLISGISVTVNVSTTIAAGLAVSEAVTARGVILPDGTWLAHAIDRAGLAVFDFVGVVMHRDPWNVSGLALAVNAQTDLDADIAIGNRVRAAGQIQPDGAWLAERIEQLDEGRRHAIQFTGRVTGAAPWVIGAVSVTVDSQTRILGEPRVGDLARVKGNLQPDGQVSAHAIARLAEPAGCSTLTAVVSQTSAGQITLLDGTLIPLTSTTLITGELRSASVIALNTCLAADGRPGLVSLVVLYQLDPLPAPLAPTAAAPAPAVGDTVVICHIPPGNPSRRNTLTVGAEAVRAHLDHGDTLGPCAGVAPSKRQRRP